MKDSFLDLLRFKGRELTKSSQQKKVKPFLLSMITIIALTLDNVGLVLGMNGAIMGSAINYIFPSIMYLKSTTRRINNGALIMKPKIRFERLFNKLLIGFGIIVGCS